MVDKKHKIHGKKVTLARPLMDFAYHGHPSEAGGTKRGVGKQEGALLREVDLHREADRVILNAYAPPAVLVSDEMQVLQFRGDTSHYLIPAPGKATFDLIRMAREGLMAELRGAILEARKKQTRVVRDKVSVQYDGGIRETRLQVIPLKHPAASARFYVVLFEEQGAAAAKRSGAPARSTRGENLTGTAQLRRAKEELDVTKQHLQTVIEEYEAANEELKSANEEILSSNEEMQSTNEELETAKEELQSSNEELTTMNEEVQNRNRELGQLNNDLHNLLTSANLAVVVLGRDLHIRICTPRAERLLKLLPTDIGRPITDLHLGVDVPELESLITDSIDNVKIRELEVKDRDGQRYTMSIRPYKTSDNRIDGAVLVFVQANGAPSAAKA